MNYLIAFLLAAVGLTILVRNKILATDLTYFFTKHLGITFGPLAHRLGWDNPEKPFNVFFYRFIIILIGLFLLIMALHELVGTIYL